MNPEAQRALDRYTSDHHGDLSDVAGFAETMFNAGYRIAWAHGVEFSGIAGQLSNVESKVVRILTLVDSVMSSDTAGVR